MCFRFSSSYVFFFNHTATTEIYTLSLHDALPILRHLEQLLDHPRLADRPPVSLPEVRRAGVASVYAAARDRSEEHTSELQSRQYLVCRLLLEKKKKTNSHEEKKHPSYPQCVERHS